MFIPGRMISAYRISCNPCNQPGTTWSTEDGSVYFSVYEEEKTFFQVYGENRSPDFSSNAYNGKIKVGDKEYNFFIDFSVAYLDFCLMSSDIEEEFLEVMNLKTSNDEAYRYDRDFYNAHLLADLSIKYKGKDHFIATVTESTVFDVGTVLDFYRTN
jgi:hypothetical protein